MYLVHWSPQWELKDYKATNNEAFFQLLLQSCYYLIAIISSYACTIQTASLFYLSFSTYTIIHFYCPFYMQLIPDTSDTIILRNNQFYITFFRWCVPHEGFLLAHLQAFVSGQTADISGTWRASLVSGARHAAVPEESAASRAGRLPRTPPIVS